MKKVISVILIGLVFYSFCFAQQKTFGYKISGGSDIISDAILIQDGFVLDSANSNNQIFRFEYNQLGKLSRDINIITLHALVTVDGRQKWTFIPGCRDFYYNNKGNIDSMVATGWDDSLGVYVDNSSGYTIHYSYDNNGILLSKATSRGGVVSSIDKYSYDSLGNLTSIQTTFNGPDTAYEIREYDYLTRLTMIKNIINGTPLGKQYTYSYDSSANVNCLIQTSYTGEINNKYNYFLKFDESGKVADEIMLYTFQSDSTWRDTTEITFNYDEYGRIIQMSQNTWFHYNQVGNLDSMVVLHSLLSGYLGDKGTFIDSYGNSITLPSYVGFNHFYYSSFITGIKEDKSNNNTFSLSQNYPNPFNPTTTISFYIPSRSLVSLTIFDILGRKVAAIINNEILSAGNYSKQWNASDIPSGVYFYQLQAGTFTETKKLILLR